MHQDPIVKYDITHKDKVYPPFLYASLNKTKFSQTSSKQIGTLSMRDIDMLLEKNAKRNKNNFEIKL